ncbi:MAG TPA: alpha/beta hydrolase [Gelria sp.]|jgi:alpha-beta hydrolase superfamily lysophospholipase|nr:alpha/beta hydrolase [Gelria sp.]
MPDYALLDKQAMLRDYLFYPRRDSTPPPAGAFDIMVPVEKGKDEPVVACRFFLENADWPWILYFHGNGEVAADYNQLCRLYHQIETNLVVADYRGYGLSSGQPGFQYLIQDAHVIYRTVRNEIKQRNYSQQLWLMGRSLGSTSALELASHYQDHLQGLIIESGFASITRLVTQWGLPADHIQMEMVEEQCLEMLHGITMPALIIHGERDSLVYPQEGKLIFDNLGNSEKSLEMIPGAGHNDIIVADIQRYFGSIRKFMQETASSK